MLHGRSGTQRVSHQRMDGDVDSRYAIPTHPRSETTRFCHLRKDYFDDVVAIVHLAQDDRGPRPCVGAPDRRCLGLTAIQPHSL